MQETIWIIAILQSASLAFGAGENPHVRIDQGLMKGKWMISKSGTEHMGFLKVPFAAPPVGDLRFEMPQEPGPWDDVLDATTDAAMCIQKDIFMKEESTVDGEEDCLYLNVFTRRVNTTTKDDLHPVMVHIHGGAFLTGTGNTYVYSPDYLMDEDIVLVSIAYRLGALGFLSMEDGDLPGNMGLKDQAMALKWIQKNIIHFGGDPNLVTIFGESAGGASTHFHMMSPMSKGLFHRAISQSGSTLSRWAVGQPGFTKKNSIRVAELLGCPTSPTKDMVKCLKEKPAADIINTDTEFMVWNKNPVIPFRPVVEKLADPKFAFLPEHPSEVMKHGRVAQVPWIVGLTSGEGAMGVSALFRKDKLFEDLDQDFENLAPIVFYLDQIPGLNAKQAAKKVRRFYFGGQPINKDTALNLSDIYTDAWFLNGIDESLRLSYHPNRNPIYFYYFDHHGAVTFASLFGSSTIDLGVSHGDDMIYLFPLNNLFPGLMLTEEDEKYRKIFVKMWTDFARFGNPTPAVSDLIPTKWKPISSENFEYLHMGQKSLSMKANLLLERTTFWSILTDTNNLSGKDEL